jgi:hypothetical protein
MKIQKKDIIPVSIISIGAVVFGYVFFGTDIFIAHEKVEVAQPLTDNGLQNFNLTVTEKPVDTYSGNKVLAYDAELRKEKADANAKLQASYNATVSGPAVNDLTDLIAGQKESKAPAAVESAAADLQDHRVATTIALPQTTAVAPPAHAVTPVMHTSTRASKKKQHPSASIDSKPIESASPKKRRRGDPEFGSSPAALRRDSTVLVRQTKDQFTAIIHGRQTVIDGARVTLRLTTPFAGPCELAVNSMLSGIITFSGHRLEIAVTVCQKEGRPTKLIAYDATDGLPGLYIDGLNTGQELKKEALDEAVGQAVSDLGVPVVDKVIRSASAKKLSNTSVNLESGRTLYLTLKEK